MQKLKHAMAEYENDRWRIISGKVGNGFSAAACKEKGTELESTGSGQPGDEGSDGGEAAHEHD